MSDKEKLIALLIEFGVGFQDGGNVVTCRQGMAKVDGYGDFYTTFTFDDEGRFIDIGARE